MSDAAQRALVVDDAELGARTLASVLRFLGYEVRYTTTLAAAVGELDAWDPHVVVVDHRLADGDGLELAERLSAERPHIRVVVVSADPAPGTASVPWLRKPIEHNDLAAALGTTPA